MEDVFNKAHKRIVLWIFSLSFVYSVLTLSLPIASASEEKYPTRPVNIIIAYSPGGMLDLQAKLIGDKLAEILGVPFLRIHKPGAGGTLGASLAARAEPDGYTMFVGTSSGLVLSPIVKTLDYKLGDFIPLGIYARGSVFFAVKANAKWKNLGEFVEEAKKQAGEMKVSSFGKLTTAEFVIEEFSKQAGIKLKHVPYKGCPEAITALLGGHVDGNFCTTSTGQLEAGSIKILAVADYERSKVLPNVKTFKEFGFDVSLPIWYSLFVPNRTSPRIVEKLSNAMQEIFSRYPQELREGLRRLEVSATFHNSSDSSKIFEEDYKTTLRIAKELGVAAK